VRLADLQCRFRPRSPGIGSSADVALGVCLHKLATPPESEPLPTTRGGSLSSGTTRRPALERRDVFRYRLHAADGDDLGEAAYAMMIHPGEEIHLEANRSSAWSTSSRSRKKTTRRSSGC
jgi:hypothetical protein